MPKPFFETPQTLTGTSQEQLQTLYRIPCGKDLYYEAYRKFFWLLSSKKKI